MRPVSNRYLSSLRGTHRAVTEAYVVAAGQTGVTPAGTEIPVLEGDVELDANSAVRSTLDMTTDGTDMFPDNADDLLAPYGNEVFIRRGISFGGGSVEWVPLGYFRINSVEQPNAPEGPIRIAASDRMVGIVEARLVAPQQFASTDTYGTVVTTLIQEVYPWATIQWDDTTDTDALGRTLIAEEDRYEFLDEMITARGKIWYWDHRGILVIREAPNNDDPVWVVNAGENGVLVALSRDLSREGVYNAVVASGEALDTVEPPRAVAIDDNPLSPTYWNGDFGKVPRFYVSPFITTTAQAQSAANALLQQKLGLPYSVDFTTVPNVALEPWDPVVVNPTNSNSYEEAQNLAWDSFTRPLTNTWGTADSGQAWSSATPADLDGTGTAGTWSPPAANTTAHVTLSGLTVSDVDGYFTVAVPALVTGNTLVASALVRYSFTTGHNGYQLRIEFRTDGKIGVKISRYVDGTFTELESNNPVPGLTYSAAQRWRVHFRAVGNQFRIRVWPEGESEPSAWQLEAVDSSLVSGSAGFWFWRISGNTNVAPHFHIDDYELNTYPGLAHGAEIHVIDRIRIPLLADGALTAETREQTLVVIGTEA